MLFKAKAIVLATGGVGKAWKITSNSWECTGDGITLASTPGADLIDMECIQFHPTGMVWPTSVRGILVTEGVRGDGGTLQELRGRALHVQLHPRVLQGPRRPTTKRKPTPGTRTRRTTGARRTCCRATRSPGRSTPRSRPGGGARTAASSSTSRRAARADYISKRLPSMYHQFKELAGVDITKEPMEVGPTCHYIMGGVRVDADTAATACPASSRRARWPAACTAPTASAATRSPTCWCSAAAPDCTRPVREALAGRRERGPAQVEAAAPTLLAPFEGAGNENPYAIHADLQETMQALVGIIRIEGELRRRSRRSPCSSSASAACAWAAGARSTRAGTSPSTCTRCSPSPRLRRSGALERKESRGGHTRDDYPFADDRWGKINVVVRRGAGS